MKHMVLIAGIVYPNASATGRCALNYVELLSDEFEIDVVYLSSEFKDTSPHIFNGKKYFPCVNWRYRKEQWFSREVRRRKIYKVGVLFFKGIGRFQSKIMFPNNLYWFSSESLKKLILIHKQNPIDVIFSVNSPFSAHLAAKRFKKRNPEVRWISYTVDPYSTDFGIRPFWLSFKKAMEKEISCLEKADTNFLSEELIEHKQEFAKAIHAKALPYLLTFDNRMTQNSSIRHFEKDYINLVYAGSFYRDIRNPQRMLEVVYQLKETNIRLHIYSGGGCLETIRTYSKRPGSNIFLYPPVKHDELLDIYDEADVLVTISNSNRQYSPSKVFEYISTGKPIIEFGNNNQNSYLASYPAYLYINHDDSDDKARLLNLFCLTHYKQIVSTKFIEKTFKKHLAVNIKKILEIAVC